MHDPRPEWTAESEHRMFSRGNLPQDDFTDALEQQKTRCVADEFTVVRP